VPLLGLLAADYFVLSGRRYAVEELYQPGGRYWFGGGVRWLGMIAWIAGVATYLAISGLPSIGIDSLLPWVEVGASLPSFVVAFVLHLALGWLAGQQAG
jgi:cytosine/uracil/thiamine/allantoin permease